MRVLMLSWEFPPLVVGGLGRHVEALATHLVAQGHDVRVVTRGEDLQNTADVHEGVRVHRAARDPLALDFTIETLLSWAQAGEHALVRAALPLLRDWQPDVVHAHDWLVAQSALTVAEASGAPLVTTIHATEVGRHQGWLPAPLNTAIHSVERWLARRSAAVITCSASMRDEVVRALEIDDAVVIPNGVDADRWRTTTTSRRAARGRLGVAPLIVCAGRLVHEKGVQDVIEALPRLRRSHPGVRLVVAGTGPYADDLRALARRRRVAAAVEFAGFVTDDDLRGLFAAADVVAVPSRYEPFGLVALEAAAAGAPVVASRTGGLGDLVRDGIAVGSFDAGDVAGLAAAVRDVLDDGAAAGHRAARARRRVRGRYTWTRVARATAGVYEAARRADP